VNSCAQTFATTTTYDAAGRVKTVKPPGLESTSRQYDDLGRVASTTDTAKNQPIRLTV